MNTCSLLLVQKQWTRCLHSLLPVTSKPSAWGLHWWISSEDLSHCWQLYSQRHYGAFSCALWSRKLTDVLQSSIIYWYNFRFKLMTYHFALAKRASSCHRLCVRSQATIVYLKWTQVSLISECPPEKLSIASLAHSCILAVQNAFKLDVSHALQWNVNFASVI